MKKHVLIISVVLISILSLAKIFITSHDEPKEVINKFMQISAQKDFEVLVPFVTNEPSYVTQEMMGEFYRTGNITRDNESSERSSDVASGITHSGKYDGKTLIRRMVVVQGFFDLDRYVKEIVDSKENGKEARVRVRLGSSENDRSIQEYDFFLFKEDDGWKIFQINYPKLDKKYDLYKFYANPR